jgi:MFS family permease
VSDTAAPGAAPAPPTGGRFLAFQYRDFRLYWIGQCASNVGTWLQIVATGWLVLELTNSPLFLGLNALIQAIPLLVFSLVGGVIADRFDRYRLSILAQVLDITINAAYAALVVTGLIRVEFIFVYSLLWMIANGLTNPARHAFVPHLVPAEGLVSAVSLVGVLWHGSAVFGPAAAGLIAGVWGLPVTFCLNVGFQAVFLGTLLLMKTRLPPVKSTGASPWEGLTEGLSYAWHNTAIRVLLITVFILSMAGRSYPQIMPLFARQVFDVGTEGLGFMLAVPAVGTVLAGIAVAAARNLALTRWFLITTAILGGAVIAFAFAPTFWLTILPLLVMGMSAQASVTIANTLLLQSTEDRLRGRILSFYTIATWVAHRMGALPAGLLAEILGIPLAVGLGGIVLLAVTALVAQSGALRPAKTAAPAQATI